MTCREFRHPVFFDEKRPFSVSNCDVVKASGDFCARGSRFGTHASNECFLFLLLAPGQAKVL